MKKISSLLLALCFLIAISGIHGFTINHTCHNHQCNQYETATNTNPTSNSANQDHDNSDCPCIFHSQGMIICPLTFHLNLQVLLTVKEVFILKYNNPFLNDHNSTYHALRAPPAC